MSVAVVSSSKEKNLLEKREEIFTRYKALWDIPEEKTAYEHRLAEVSLSEEDVKKTPSELRWMLQRLIFRIEKVKQDLQIALEQVEFNRGVLKLAGKNLCDLTAAELYPDVRGVWKVELSGNFLKRLPDFCRLKPMISCVNASSNLQDIEKEFYSIRQKNRTCFDLFHLLEGAYQTQDDTDSHLIHMMQQIYENPSKLEIAELARIIHERYLSLVFSHKKIEVHPKIFEERAFGGLSSFIELSPFKRLKILDLSRCQLEFRAPINWLKGLTYLKVLNLSDSMLREVPLGVKELTNLVWLDISSTHIEKLPDWIGDFPALRVLKLSRTKIDRLPVSFSSLELTDLDLEGCPIVDLQYVPRTLERLNIKGSLVDFIPAHLEVLLKNNGIEIDETNKRPLLIQKEIFSRYSTLELARFFMNQFKARRQGCLPVAIQVHVKACSIFGCVALFAVACLLYTLCIPLIASCPKNPSRRGSLSLTDQSSPQNYKKAVSKKMGEVRLFFKDLAQMMGDVRLIVSNP